MMYSYSKMLAKAVEFSFDGRLESALDDVITEGGAQTGVLVGSVGAPWSPCSPPTHPRALVFV